MAGHSKWANIKHRKGAQDKKRGKVFMQLAKEIYVAAKQGGGDPEMNAHLRKAIDKAKANNVPNDNIDRAVAKATGSLEGVNYEELTYEGYGPAGVAILVETLTDNKNRTVGEVRTAFNKNGGNLGESGSVAFMFDRKGYLVIDREEYPDVDEEELMLEAVEAGADEMETNEDSFEIYTDPQSFQEVREALEASDYNFATAEVTFFPQTRTHLEGADAEKMVKLINALEDLEDVQEVYHNLEADDEIMEQL
ncbi:transcriptional regulator [Pontibacillus halophilus JSM 076056 = DSM 19796]|uniref:Probable transcriptional regulatory protein N781_10715 n=1 Tax=Pontibacillus halophilus JSM 076056 = DSM 19796 TaxID=1385510 RepID=A0A0A5ICG4_9BACI|nr:YebC/PmpR family DNA-binding transcriptional regulator [Pontibacillus halophilus]KGX93497.1 transcriptional regulator [Pontibacillus halophilus JSM 076056 = DSM 19796]